MSYYQKHVFFCTNQRREGRQCCQNADANMMREYTKKTLKRQGLTGPGKIRISSAGCLGRCPEGPVMVIYPEGAWYTYQTQADIDEIIHSHLLGDRPVARLLLPHGKTEAPQTFKDNA